MGSAPDFWNLIAATRGVPDGWRWYEVRGVGERPNHAFMVKGAVCTALYSSGKRKGETNWTKRDRSTERELVITPTQLDEFKEQWERDNDKCSKCGGDGQELASWHFASGKTYRDCSRCKATGRAPTP